MQGAQHFLTRNCCGVYNACAGLPSSRALPGFSFANEVKVLRRKTAAILACIAVILLPAAWRLAPASMAQPQPAAEAETWLHYDVDYSQVPSWVQNYALTLRVYVGQADGVRVIAGGQVVPVAYSRSEGWATFTTTSARVDIRLQDLSTPLDQIGEVRKAALRDDKRMAYSLTFDDGRKTVITIGKPMLDRLGVRAAVAVIGRWLDEDGTEFDYMTRSELTSLLRAGWGLYNHSYSHYDPLALDGRIVEDILLANQAFAHAIPGFQPIVFTPPYNHELYAQAADQNQGLLGFQLMQVGGGPVVPVDQMSWDRPPYHLGRWDIGRPRENGSTTSGALWYMDYADRVLSENPSMHLWLNLHSHNVAPNDIAGSSMDYLYFSYGPGGKDQVWIAPADEVYQYLAVRDHARVSRVASRGVAVAYAPPVIHRLVLREGWQGYTGVEDTYISLGAPNQNFNSPTSASTVRLQTPDKYATLIRFDLSAIPSSARVVRASLGLYAYEHSNRGEIIVTAHTARKRWNVNEATWRNATAEQLWEGYGANATVGASRDRDAAYTDSRSLRRYRYTDDFTGDVTDVDDATWYSLDVTKAAAEWVADPATNYGLVLKAWGDSVEVRFAASEDRNAALRPCLVVTYVTQDDLQEPLETVTPTATVTGSPMPSATPTATETRMPGVTPTATPTETATPSASPTGKPSATHTPAHRRFLPMILVQADSSTLQGGAIIR